MPGPGPTRTAATAEPPREPQVLRRPRGPGSGSRRSRRPVGLPGLASPGADSPGWTPRSAGGRSKSCHSRLPSPHSRGPPTPGTAAERPGIPRLEARGSRRTAGWERERLLSARGGRSARFRRLIRPGPRPCRPAFSPLRSGVSSRDTARVALVANKAASVSAASWVIGMSAGQGGFGERRGSEEFRRHLLREKPSRVTHARNARTLRFFWFN